MSAPPHADPGRGVFETMLVLAGRPVELDAHLERLEASLGALYGAKLPAPARTAALERASAMACGKLRITAAPRQIGRAARGPADPSPLRLSVDAEEIDLRAIFPGPQLAIALRSATVAGGLGEHKWIDRRLLQRIETSFPPRQLALLLDAEGSVLEASRASVFCAGTDRLVTPPTDGRILSSIARKQAIEAARAAGLEVRERALTLDDLRDGEVFLTGSVRGVEPAGSLDEVELPPPGEISALVADGLRRRWGVPGEPVAAGAGERRAGLPGR